MKKSIKPFLGLLLAIGMNSCNVEKADATQPDITQGVIQPTSKEGNIIPDQYIVQLSSDLIKSARDRFQWTAGMTRETKGQVMEALNRQVETDIDKWLAENNISPSAVLYKHTTTFVGFTVNMPEADFKVLQRKGGISSIEYDRIEEIPSFVVEGVDDNKSGNVALAQTTPVGITNAGGAASSVNTDAWAWVIDSGIDLDHPDLNVVTNTTYAKTFAPGTSSPDDANGHGTHVAGTIAARNNTIGVIGVVPGAPVIPVRVFGSSGGSSSSTIINGINHVATYDAPGDVVNLSLGGFYGSGCSTGSAYRTAINALATTSRVAIAAGNSSANAAQYQPACLNGTNIFTVASMTASKGFSSFSNFGAPPVDWIATGSSVYSTYLRGGYATLSGTSMATPHVAGIMHARNAAPAQNGTVTSGGVTYKIAVR